MDLGNVYTEESINRSRLAILENRQKLRENHDAWVKRPLVECYRRPIPILPKTPPKGHIRLCCVSDTHSRHNKLDPLPPGDILIHAGEYT